jgi:hypothetical protein
VRVADRQLVARASVSGMRLIAADVFGQEDIEEVEKELDRGPEELTASLRKLVRVNTSDYVDRFVRALAADAVYPMDF